MNKSLLKKLIVICSILILVIIILIIGLKASKKSVDNVIKEEGIEEAEKIDEEIMVQHEASERFFMVAQSVSSYLDIINKNNSSYFGYNENQEYVKIVNQNEKIYHILSKEYIEKNNITVDNVENFVPNVESKLLFVPLKMKFVQNNEDSNLYQYAVYGYVTDINYDLSQDLYIIVNMDFSNNTFSVEPIKEGIKEIDELNLESNNESIEENEDNRFTYKVINDEFLAKTYLDYYKKMTLGSPKLAYQYLDSEYREKRFGTVENYIQYVNTNKEEIKAWNTTKYLVNYKETTKEYVCQDKYESLYMFSEKSIMDFTVTLDTYTIPTEKFTTTYNSSNDQKKVMMNVDKWIQMLNNRDYTAAYKVLDETYRNNTFGSEEQFEAIMREKLPLHYKAEYSNFSEENGIYIQEIELSDITGKSTETIKISIIMQLKEDLDFVMSFSFQEQE